VVVTGGDIRHFQVVFLEEGDFLGCEGGFDITMAESADLLRVHPVEEAFFATVAPGPHIAIVGERDRMIFSHSYINDFVLRETFNVLWLLKVYIVLVTVA